MARLPQPGGDAGNWGDILNDYLAQTHKADGTLKDGSVARLALTSTVRDELDTKLAQAQVDARVTAVGNGVYARIPSGTATEFGLSIVDSSVPNGVRWSAPQESVARALGWAIVTDPQWAGGAKTDGTNAAPAIQAALAAAKCVYIPEGNFTITSSINVTGANGKRLIGAGRTLTTLVVASTVTTAALLGTSAGTQDFSASDFTIDCGWATGDTVIAAVQLTNATRSTIDSLGVKDSGGAGILLQGLNTAGGCPDSVVRRCVIEGAGLSDGSTGFGIVIKDKSDRCLIESNRLLNIKGGMGIGLGGGTSGDYPQMCRIISNTVAMVASTIGFEAIGITTGCNNTIVSANVVRDTYDNGISVTADDCTVVGNNVDGTWNHGITAGGRGTQVIGNFVRNVGKQDASAYGGITIDTGGSWCVVSGNTIEDNQTTHTMSHGVKINASGGNNRIGLNSISGWLVSPYFGLVSTDIVMDAETKTDGYSFSKLYTDAINAKTTNGTVGMSSAFNPTNFTVAGSGAAKNAQVTVFSNAGATRANIALSAATGQAAPLLTALDPAGNILSSITKDGVFRSVVSTTALRPSAAIVGVGGQLFDTTLGKPIWSNGTNWVDATGVVV